MSRIGLKPIMIPSGVEVTIAENNTVTVKGPKGTLTNKFNNEMIIKKEESTIVVERPTENKKHKSLHGLTRTLINNMVVGVSEGFEKEARNQGCRLQGCKAGQEVGNELRFLSSS